MWSIIHALNRWEMFKVYCLTSDYPSPELILSVSIVVFLGQVVRTVLMMHMDNPMGKSRSGWWATRVLRYVVATTIPSKIIADGDGASGLPVLLPKRYVRVTGPWLFLQELNANIREMEITHAQSMGFCGLGAVNCAKRGRDNTRIGNEEGTSPQTRQEAISLWK
jgi:hypothetical protein